jgi:haloacetate dehalogenase
MFVSEGTGDIADVAQDDVDASVKIACPVMPRVWAEMASNLVTHAIPECGHLPHEEKAEEINRLLINFLADWKG